MARFDIMPIRSAHGGAYALEYGTMTALGTAFDVGEPVSVVDAGTITAAPQDTTEWILADADAGHVMGIAAFGPGAASSAARPSDRININPRTGVAFTTGDVIGFWPINRDIQFRARFGDDTGANFVTPARTDMGEVYQVVYGTAGTPDNGWMIAQTAATSATDVCAQVLDILDSAGNGINTRVFSGTGYWVVVNLFSVV